MKAMISALIVFFILTLTTAKSPKQEFAIASNLFTESVYKQLSQSRNGNFLVSPFSAETILAFVQSGCRGDSAEELRKALHLPEDKDTVETEIKYIFQKFKYSTRYTLLTANKMYLQKNYTVRNEFKTAGKRIYGTKIEPIDFATNAVQAAKTINLWVEKRTNNKIKNMVGDGDFNNDTKAVLINTLYFKAEWLEPFARRYTKKENFYKTPNEVIQVDTLHHHDKLFNYHECSELQSQFLELPFMGDDASMVIVLPNKKDGLSSLEDNLIKVIGKKHRFRRQSLNVTLPKFNIETSIDFKKILEGLGVTKIFQHGTADLSGISGDPKDLYIQRVAQKTFIDVCEEGVEASSATSIFQGVFLSLPISAQKSFIADHAFLFYITVKDVLILIGRVTDPSKG